MSKNKNLKNTSISCASKLRNLTIGVVSAGAMMAGGVSSAAALDDVVEEKLRILNCIGLLITDPDLHLVECGTSDTSGSESLAPLIFVKPPPPPLVCDEGYEISNRGGCVPINNQ